MQGKSIGGRWLGHVPHKATDCPFTVEAVSAPAAATPTAPAPAPKRSVQELMRPYYGAVRMRHANWCMGRACEGDMHADVRLTDIVYSTYAGKLFPHQQMYRWLAYGNGERKPQHRSLWECVHPP